MATTEVGRPGARLVLAGSGTSPVRVEVIYQSRATRMSRALLTLAVALVIAPVVFFLPPHFLWPVVALGVGLVLAWRSWTGEYHVVEFAGACPRCDTALELKQGARVRGRHALECFGCHRQPELVIDPVEE